MKVLTLSALIAFSLAACGGADRNADATNGAESANTATTDVPAATMPTDTTTATGAGNIAGTDTMGNAAMNTGACEGLTGQAQTDCLNNAGPAGSMNGDMTGGAAGSMGGNTGNTGNTGNNTGTTTDTDTQQPTNTDATTPPQS